MKIKFIILSLLVTFCSYSQLDKKTWLVGGTGSFNSYKQDETFTYQYSGDYVRIHSDVKEFELSPKVGLFIIDKLAVGLSSSFTSSKSKYSAITVNAYSGSYDEYQFSVGPFVRYYFLKKEKPFNILTEANYEFGNLKYLSSHSGDNEKGSINKFSFLAGPELFFNSAIGMEVLVGYKMYNNKKDNPNKTSAVHDGFQVSIGFQIHLEKL